MTIRNSSRTGYLRAISRVLLCVFVVGQLSESVGLAQGGGIFAMWTQAENVKAKSRDIVARNEARKTRKSVKVAKAHKQQYNTGVQKTDNSTKTPVVTAPPKPPSAPLNYQTFALKVITLARQPVANLPVPLEVSIPLKQGSRVTGTKVLGTRTVSTDQDGLARYTKIGPLPAQLKIGLRDPDAEYSIYDEGKVAIALVRGSNLQIAEDQRPRLDISTLTASLYPMMAAATRAKARAKAVAAPAKEIVFNASQPTEIVVQRNIADLVVKSPEGAQVDLVGVSGYSDSWSSSRDTNASDGVTTTRFRIHRSLLEEGAVAVMVTKSGGAGDYEAVQRGYTPDYYNETTIEVKPEDLQLVNIKDVSIAKHLSVLDQKEQADAAYGKTKDSMDPKDGSKWWRYEDDGVWALARKWPGAKAPEVVERIRLVKPDGGSVAGIKVGDSKEKLLDTLGAAKKPERIRLQLSSGSKNKLQDTDTLAYNYFDRGLTFYVGQGASSSDSILAIDVSRTTELLTEGTSAFVPRQPISVYVEKWGDNTRKFASAREDLEQMIKQMGVVQLASSREDADYVISGGLSDFKEEKGKVIANIAYYYFAKTILAGEIRANGADGGSEVASLNGITGEGRANFSEDVAEGAVIITIIDYLARKIDLPPLLRVVLEVIGGQQAIQRLTQAMERAIPRCVEGSYRDALRQVADSLFKLADINARVIALDRQAGTVTFNVGSNQGIKEGSQFALMLAGRPISDPTKVTGLKAEYIAAEVMSVEPNSCVCQIKEVDRHVSKNGKVAGESKLSKDLPKQFPDPLTGSLAGRVQTQFFTGATKGLAGQSAGGSWL